MPSYVALLCFGAIICFVMVRIIISFVFSLSHLTVHHG